MGLALGPVLHMINVPGASAPYEMLPASGITSKSGKTSLCGGGGLHTAGIESGPLVGLILTEEISKGR